MTTFDMWLLLLLAPAVWWLMGMVRAVMNARERAVLVSEWDTSVEEAIP